MRADRPDRAPTSGADTEPAEAERTGEGWGVLGVAALLMLPVLCCAGPALLAGGALGTVGAFLANPWLIGAGVTVLLVGLGWALSRRASRSRDDRDQIDLCCAPEHVTSSGSGAGTDVDAEHPDQHPDQHPDLDTDPAARQRRPARSVATAPTPDRECSR